MIKQILQLSLIAAATSSMAYAKDETKITIGGFIKLDAYSDSNLNTTKGPRGSDLLDFRATPLDGSDAANRSRNINSIQHIDCSNSGQ